jgi:hypothetical protein
MADYPFALSELWLRLASLPPISRATHLGGPALHARRLVDLWKVDDSDDVPLAQAFRLLDAGAIAGAILRTLAVRDYPGDPRYWTFSDLEDLLPGLQDLCWQGMLDGTLLVEANRGREKPRAVLPVELQRLQPDWRLSRLCLGERDEFVDVRVRRAPDPVEPAQRRKRPSRAELKAAMEEIAREAARAPAPTEQEVWNGLKARLGQVSRQDARGAIAKYAPQLRGRRGYRSKRKSPS